MTEAFGLSLSTAAARRLATTTKSVPQMRAVSPRWLLRTLPWVDVSAGTYRVNRRLAHPVGDGRVGCTWVGTDVRVIPHELRELPVLRGFDDDEVLTALADRFERRELGPGDTVVERGRPASELVLVAHGKVRKFGAGEYDDATLLAVLSEGDHAGADVLPRDDAAAWSFTLRAVTPCTVLALPRRALAEVAGWSAALREHLANHRVDHGRPRNKLGEAAIEVASGHAGEPALPGTFADYEPAPHEYELSVAQTVLRLHSRVADLFNEPMDQLEHQLRLTIQALRERQEHELVNNAAFGLLATADPAQRIPASTGPPTPDDLDELISRRRKTRLLFAHPKAIAAFHHECSRRGVMPAPAELDGTTVASWRGVPLLPCDKIPISQAGMTSIVAMRVGERSSGVVGLHQTGIPDEVEPGLNARFMGVDEHGIIAYLVSAYYSAAVLVPDALGILDHVEIGRAA